MALEIKNLTIGEGMPKICVPITGITEDEILEQADRILESPFDLVEWRVDFYVDVFNTEKTLNVLQSLREKFADAPLLFTFRTENEGGKYITTADYLNLLIAVCESQLIDLVDVEIFMAEAAVKTIIEIAHANNIKVIASNHDFKKTPDILTILSRFDKMDNMNADILKIAAMPTSKEDVINLLSATVKAKQLIEDKPIVTMSMGDLGRITRICGEFSGSAITFGTVGEASAPGQIDASDLKSYLLGLTLDSGESIID
jgi:3-dehydroquinate dehydratase-1